MLYLFPTYYKFSVLEQKVPNMTKTFYIFISYTTSRTLLQVQNIPALLIRRKELKRVKYTVHHGVIFSICH